MSTSDGSILGTTQIVNHGPASERWNLVLVAEGYRESEMAQFAADAQDFVDALFATPPFDNLKIRWAINGFRIDVTSTDSGADDPITDSCPGTGATAATYFDASFCGDNSIRRLLVANNATVIDVLDAQVPEWHQAIVIVNSSTYGGSGGQIGVTSTSGEWERIAIHELGHAAFDLADEYEYYAGCGVDADRDNYVGSEPGAPNVTINTDRATIKWGDLIDPATSLPTTSNADCSQCDPQPSPVPPGTVGAFEGARYYHCGLYRPEFNCIMRQLSADFCAVCQRAIRNTLTPFMASTPADELELIKSFEELLHSFEQLLAKQPCQEADLLKSFEGLLHSFEALLHDRQGKQGFLEKELLQSFECLLYSFEDLLHRFVGLGPKPLPKRCKPHDGPEVLPDLVPVAPFPPPPPNALETLPQNFCTQPEGGGASRAIRVIVRNQGSAPAGNSVTRVEFFKALGGGIITATLTRATPPLGPGQETTLDFEIPRGCYLTETACQFRITVDAMDDVAESNEANNSVESFCPPIAL
jgi:hypothetical protein